MIILLWSPLLKRWVTYTSSRPAARLVRVANILMLALIVHRCTSVIVAVILPLMRSVATWISPTIVRIFICTIVLPTLLLVRIVVSMDWCILVRIATTSTLLRNLLSTDKYLLGLTVVSMMVNCRWWISAVHLLSSKLATIASVAGTLSSSVKLWKVRTLL